ncbi:hypothetical protein [Bradyrhizobium sp. DOA9]|uniref:hypothetical protein n=1 Tax=Bradyrhizobium sp. DOA9 TaxID=1126627 RepID=UPI00046ABC6F|nr:hypothetical protein [Bradyrhizobium sp. DOA9]GAJ35422.1 hypothetical protein BDOA9_0146280 [Bradyrhizobium sp. DOA9]
MGPLHKKTILTGGFPIYMDRSGAVDLSNFDMTLHLILLDGPFAGQPAILALKHLAQTAEAIVADFCKAFPNMLSPTYFAGDDDPL